MKCIICKAKEKDGVITHTKTCPDYGHKDHETKVQS